MPEAQVSTAIEDMVNKGKGMPTTINVDNEQCDHCLPLPPLSFAYSNLYPVRLEIVPITHSQKKGTMIAHDTYEWTSPIHQPGWLSYAPPHWIECARDLGLEHLRTVYWAGMWKTRSSLLARSRSRLGQLYGTGGQHHRVHSIPEQSRGRQIFFQHTS